jgi:hypothetical protein
MFKRNKNENSRRKCRSILSQLFSMYCTVYKKKITVNVLRKKLSEAKSSLTVLRIRIRSEFFRRNLAENLYWPGSGSGRFRKSDPDPVKNRLDQQHCLLPSVSQNYLKSCFFLFWATDCESILLSVFILGKQSCTIDLLYSYHKLYQILRPTHRYLLLQYSSTGNCLQPTFIQLLNYDYLKWLGRREPYTFRQLWEIKEHKIFLFSYSIN